MGESVAEATITNWLKEVGDKIEADEAVLEIATDKVDSEVPSEVSGILVEQLFGKDDLVQVGQTIAIIETEGGELVSIVKEAVAPEVIAEVTKTVDAAKKQLLLQLISLILKILIAFGKNIAKEEGVSVAELASISGTGKEGRVTKNDILEYVKNRTNQPVVSAPVVPVQNQLQPSSSKAARYL
jgi:2-oxoglutarate dehydrogenase E2 component (dihydrolipoamide succinyltransferase)